MQRSNETCVPATGARGVKGTHSHVPRPVSMIEDGGLAVGAQVRAKSSDRERVGLQGCLMKKRKKNAVNMIGGRGKG